MTDFLQTFHQYLPGTCESRDGKLACHGNAAVNTGLIECIVSTGIGSSYQPGEIMDHLHKVLHQQHRISTRGVKLFKFNQCLLWFAAQYVFQQVDTLGFVY